MLRAVLELALARNNVKSRPESLDCSGTPSPNSCIEAFCFQRSALQMLLEVDAVYEMHDSMMSHLGMDPDHHHGAENYSDGWVEINSYTSSSQHQSPIHEYGGFGFAQPVAQSLPSEPTFSRMSPPQPTHPPQHQQLLPLIMPSHPTWPSMLTHGPGYQAAPVSMTPVSLPLKTSKAPAVHAPSPRKTLTDDDRRRMCKYHEENPTIKQTEIGAMFGVERSTVSKVLRQKEKYLFPEDRSLSPVKRSGKGKFPDIDRALSNWVRNSQKQGIPLTDAAIKEKARFFASTVGNNESHVKANSTSWLEKFKQKNGIGGAKLLRRASETNISDSGSLNPDSAGPSAAQTPSGISPSSPGELASPTSLTPSRSQENLKADGLDNYLDFGNHYRHSNSQSTTSLNSAFTDTAPSSFSGGATSPSTPFAFSPDTTCAPFMPSQHSRLPPPANFQRPRSQTFPMLGIDPSYISGPQGNDSLTPKYNQPLTAPASALDSPTHDDMSHPFSMDSALSHSPVLHHRSSNSSMAPPSSTTPNNPASALSSPPSGSSPSSPTQDDARRALDTLLSYFNTTAPQGLVDHSEYMTVLNLTQKLRIQQEPTQTLPGGLHRIPEQDVDVGPKNEHL